MYERITGYPHQRIGTLRGGENSVTAAFDMKKIYLHATSFWLGSCLLCLSFCMVQAQLRPSKNTAESAPPWQ
jgi:hypothetical protein